VPGGGLGRVDDLAHPGRRFAEGGLEIAVRDVAQSGLTAPAPGHRRHLGHGELSADRRLRHLDRPLGDGELVGTHGEAATTPERETRGQPHQC
jgi:hypothetical protein